MCRLGSCSLLLVALALPACANKAKKKDGTYKVVLGHRVKVGAKYRLVSTGKEANALKIDGKPAADDSNKSYEFSYEAVVTVDQLSARGFPQKARHKVTKLEVTPEGGAPKSLLAKGTLVVAWHDGKNAQFTVAGKPAEPDLADVLRTVIDVDHDNALSPSQIFGDGLDKPVGASWKADGATISKAFKRYFPGAVLAPTAANVSGKVRVVDSRKVRGVPCVRVAADIQITNVAPKMAPVTPKTGTANVRWSVDLPLDKTLPIREDHFAMKIAISGKTADGKPVESRSSVNTVQSRTPLK